ncbi:dipeptidyl peptidase 1-like isoform X2 [Lineus longissimus]|uniref:dipeptidyl peptidase 1-like isoform X2 n=1 Tax=Lineus longissimus TaxID=88925 RepID=UPI00315D2BEC
MAGGSVTFCISLLFLGFLGVTNADTPANCTYMDMLGTWSFSMCSGGHDNTINCTRMGLISQKITVTLMYPDVAQDAYGNQGFWTLIYNQGFEVVINGRKFFAFSKYEGTGEHVTSFCNDTLPGWSHNLLGRDWGCFHAKKIQAVAAKVHQPFVTDPKRTANFRYRVNHDFIKQINNVQSSWKAAAYDEYNQMTIEDMIKKAGGRASKIQGNLPRPAPVTEELKASVETLPESFDWRDMNGQDFVSPVRNQASCGSCYAFASLAMNECRLRVMTNNTVQVTFSTQDIVECSPYSQGCAGGFPYLIGGKYAEDFGLVEEKCNPYTGKDGACSTDKKCKRHYSTNYRYVGGYYGACNEAVMRRALVNDGPIAVSFQVYHDFMAYKSGIYRHTGLNDRFNPWEITNHVVVVVGYGTEDGTNYWTVKNSWGPSWGEDGFFKIVRGADECSIESIAVESFPML